jgi:hypothetical protein
MAKPPEDVSVALARGEAVVYFILFSDSIFPCHLCITHKHEPPLGGVLHERLEAENMATNSVHMSIKWTYGDIIVLFHVMHEIYQKKYFLPDCTINEVLHQQLRFVFFIYNCSVCYNGNKLTHLADT